MNKKSYYAIIPADVRYDENITPNAKLLYAEITALSNEKGHCWASNDYFAQLYKVSKTSISKWISQLEQNSFIQTKLIYHEGTKQILNRYITIVNDPIEEKLNTPIEEKLKDNNTSINITSNNITPIVPLNEFNTGIEILNPLEINFNKFWKMYPKKKSKETAFKSFKKINPNKELLNTMLSQLDLFTKTKDWLKDKGQFIPYPATWLNQKRWEDEIKEEDLKEITTKDLADKYDWSDF